MMSARVCAVWACAAVLWACSGTDDGGSRPSGGDGDGDGDGTGGLVGDGDRVFDNGGTGAAAGDGDGDGSGGIPLNDDGTCDRVSVSASKADPEFLIVLDKSGSMGGDAQQACIDLMAQCPANPVPFLDPPECFNRGWGQGVDRWTPSISAVVNLTAQFDDTIPFGLMTFPADNECGVGQLVVDIDLGTSATIADALAPICPGGGTPTGPSLQGAAGVFAARQGQPDAAATAPYVLLVTDGAPTCGQGNGVTDATKQATYDAVDQLASMGIRTYVIGYDTRSDAALAEVLDEAARRGNTGDQAHRPVEDEAGLAAEFEQITQNAVSCTYVLNQEVKDASYVLVKLDGTQKNLGEPDGWALGADMLSVTLQGDACNSLQDGATHVLDISVECEVVMPQ